MREMTRQEIDKQARQAAAECLALCAHYASMVIGHLEVGDDCGAIWDLAQFQDAGRRAFRAYAPIRERMRGSPE